MKKDQMSFDAKLTGVLPDEDIREVASIALDQD